MAGTKREGVRKFGSSLLNRLPKLKPALSICASFRLTSNYGSLPHFTYSNLNVVIQKVFKKRIHFLTKY